MRGLFRKEEKYSSGVNIPCRKNSGCSVIISYDGSEKSYRFDEAGHFCTCVTKTKNGEEKTSSVFTAIKAGKEIIEDGKIAAILKELRESKFTEKTMKKLFIGDIKSVEKLEQEIEAEANKLSKKLEPLLSSKEYENYILFSNLKGEYGGIVPFTPENFDRLRSFGNNYANKKRRLMRK